MRITLVISVLAHTGIVLFAWLGMSIHRPELLLEDQPVSVEIVDVAEMRNAPPLPVVEPKEDADPTKAEEAKVEPPAPEPPKPKPAPTPPPEPEITKAPEPEPEPAPAPLEKKAEPVPKPKPEPKPDPKPAPPQLASVKVPKKPNRPKKEKKSDFDAAALLKTLEEIKKKPPETKPEEKKEKPKDDTMAKIKDILNNKASSMNFDQGKKPSKLEIDIWRAMIKKRMKPCWGQEAGAKDAGKLKVELRLFMQPDGTVVKFEVLNAGQALGNRYYRAALERAQRAVLNPRCQPFDLPVDKYNEWKTLKMNFDPSEML
ncbi:MAG: hypothetical protein VW268_13395 [Rhodospirillaceae bacterium]